MVDFSLRFPGSIKTWYLGVFRLAEYYSALVFYKFDIAIWGQNNLICSIFISMKDISFNKKNLGSRNFNHSTNICSIVSTARTIKSIIQQ